MIFIEIFIVAFLIVLNGILAMSELAIVSSRPTRLKSMIGRGVNGSRRALALSSDPGRFLSTVQIGITLVGVVAGAFSGATLGTRLSGWVAEFGVPRHVAEPLSYTLVVAIITYFSVIIGELVPKQIALRDPERMACLMAPAMMLLSKVASPFVSLLDWSGKLVLRLFGSSGVSERKVTDEEIKALVAEAESTGVIEPEERALISGVMRLGDRQVRAVMTPRRDVDFIDLTESAAQIRGRLAKSIHSRLPTCEGSPDDMSGVIQAKDLLNALLKDDDTGDLRPFVKPAPIIPDTMDAVDVIGVLRKSKVHIGLVHDEYGHFRGVVTAIDIMRAIGSEMSDPHPDEKKIVERADGSYLVSGLTPADDFAEKLGVPIGDAYDFDTVAGLVLAAFGYLPDVGETVDAYGWTFEVVDLDGRRIDKVLVSRAAKPRRRRA